MYVMANVRYVAVARVPDKVPVASFVPPASTQFTKSHFDTKLAKVLRSGRVEEHRRLTITDNEVGTIHYDSDKACLYLSTYRIFVWMAATSRFTLPFVKSYVVASY